MFISLITLNETKVWVSNTGKKLCEINVEDTDNSIASERKVFYLKKILSPLLAVRN